MRWFASILITVLLTHFGYTALFADDFYLDRSVYKNTLRFEIDNDVLLNEDSNFSNGWSFQYHSACYASWEDTGAPKFVNWVGNHLPSFGDDESIVLYGQGVGQNMITPGDLTNPNPPPGDLPYAGTLTYTLNWQKFNQRSAQIFQATVGILGKESLAQQFQEIVHENLGLGESPQGWDSQRDTEPILNLAYAHFYSLMHIGSYTDGWAVQLSLAPAAYLGNLSTAVEMGLGIRFGWNMQEGFNAFPAPPGLGFYTNMLIPKPEVSSPHGVELVIEGKATGLIYSVVYDGSVITSDDRNIDYENFVVSGMIGLNYHYYRFFSIRLAFVQETDLLIEDSLPPTQPGDEKTRLDNSYSTFMIDFHF